MGRGNLLPDVKVNPCSELDSSLFRGSSFPIKVLVILEIVDSTKFTVASLGTYSL